MLAMIFSPSRLAREAGGDALRARRRFGRSHCASTTIGALRVERTQFVRGDQRERDGARQSRARRNKPGERSRRRSLRSRSAAPCSGCGTDGRRRTRPTGVRPIAASDSAISAPARSRADEPDRSPAQRCRRPAIHVSAVPLSVARRPSRSPSARAADRRAPCSPARRSRCATNHCADDDAAEERRSRRSQRRGRRRSRDVGAAHRRPCRRAATASTPPRASALHGDRPRFVARQTRQRERATR